MSERSTDQAGADTDLREFPGSYGTRDVGDSTLVTSRMLMPDAGLTDLSPT